MTDKDLILMAIQELRADATYDQALDKLERLRQDGRLRSQKSHELRATEIPPAFKDAATPKQRMLFSLSRMPDGADIDRAIYTAQLVQGIDEALRESERGEGTDHDELFAELLKEDDQKNHLAAARRKRPKSGAAVHRSTRKAKNRSRVRPTR